MKRLLFLCFWLCALCSRAAVPTFQSFEPTQFDTNNFRVAYRAAWTNDNGIVYPALTSSLIISTNVNIYGTFSLPSKVELLTLGTNYLDVSTNSTWLLNSPTNDAAQVILSLSAGAYQGQLLFITSQNGSNSFTLPDLSEQWDVPGAYVDIQGDWLGTTNRGIILQYTAPDWIEMARFDPSQTGGGTVSGSGTLDYLPKWITPTTLGDSPLSSGNPYTVTLRSTNTQDHAFIFSASNTNSGTAFVRFDFADSSGIGSAAQINGIKNTGWGAGTPTLRDGTLSFNVQHDNALKLRLEISGDAGTVTFKDRDGLNTVATIANVSGYTGTGTNFFSDDGTYKPATGSGATINPTDLFIPYRLNSTTFSNSPIQRIDAESVQIVSGPNALQWGIGSGIGFVGADDLLQLSAGSGVLLMNGGQYLSPQVGGVGIVLGTGTNYFGGLFLGTNGLHGEYTDDGSQLLRNGVPISGGSALWASAGGVLEPSPAVPILRLEGTTATLINTNAQIDKESFGGQFLVPFDGSWQVPIYFVARSTNGANEFFAGGMRLKLLNVDDASQDNVFDSEALTVINSLNVQDQGGTGNQAINDGGAKYGIKSVLQFNGSTNMAQGAAIVGINNGGTTLQYGLVGQVLDGGFDNDSRIGVAGKAYRTSAYTNSNPVGLYGEVIANDYPRVFEPAVLLLDSQESVVPLIVGRTNNAGTPANTFKVWPEGTLSLSAKTNRIGDSGTALTYNGVAIGSGSGDVVGPASATDNAIVRFDGTTGKLVQNSATTIADTTGAINVGGITTVFPRLTAFTNWATAPGLSLLLGDGTSGNSSLHTKIITLGSGTTDATTSLLLNSASTRIVMSSDHTLAWSSSAATAAGTLNTTGDTIMSRDAAARLQLGADAAAPVSPQTISAADGSGTDKDGSNLQSSAGRGTGTGRGGALSGKTSLTTTTGSTVQTESTRYYHSAKFVDLTESTATTFANIALASSKYLGVRLNCTVSAADATDFQAVNSNVSFSAVNKAGTVTVGAVTQNDDATAASAGTLTVTYTAVANGSGVDIKANAVSSLTQTQLRCKWSILSLNSDDLGTVVAQ